jgi:lantibiotic modifying enzyme
MIKRAAGQGGFRLISDTPAGAFKPGLFRGIAGIGYQLLRIAAPDRVPSVLLWA